jgi:hypothetical protein
MAVRQACEVDERNNKITIPILLATAIAILAAAELKLVGKSI